ncbi:MAG: diacylglycerol kinase family lipid kinase [Clostridia bacterium]|nr:diacylglycerol kinase family lipid kinase [Clostridia bacterium]
MGKRALVIVNPTAGMKRSKKIMFDIVDHLSHAGYQVAAQTTTKSGDGTLFLKEYGADKDLIICCGGDGTLNEVINGLLEIGSDANLGYVPAGTTNDFARTLQLPRNPEKCIDSILAASPRTLDIGSFNGKNFTYIASLGAFTKISYSTPQKLKNAFGHSAYLMEGVKEIGNISPFVATVEADGEVFSGEFVFGSITNSTSVAGLFRLNELDVRLDDGELELMLIRNPKTPNDLVQILRGLVKSQYDPRYVVFKHVTEVKLKTATPLSWTLDGERGGEVSEAQIKVIPGAINLLM